MNDSPSRFRRSLIIVAAIHIALILGILCFMKRPIKEMNETVTWMDPGAFSSSGGLGTPQEAALEAGEKKNVSQEEVEQSEKEEIPPPAPPVEPPPAPTPEPAPVPIPEQPDPVSENTPPAEVPSDITMPTSKPISKEPPKPEPKPVPKPAPKVVPKPKPKPKPQPKPESKPKPAPKKEEQEEADEPVAKPAPKVPTPPKKKTTAAVSPAKKTISKNKESGNSGEHHNDAAKQAFLAAKNGAGNGSSSGSGNGGAGSGHGGGGADSAALGAYHELIHDRFYSQWDQPTSIPLEHKHDFVCTLRLTIEPDGTISHFMLAKSSGNPVMDDSVMAAAAKVSKIAPLPPGVGAGGAYTVNINFELE